MSCTPRDQLGGCEQGRHTPGDVRDVREPEKQWGRGRAGMLLAGDRGGRGTVCSPRPGVTQWAAVVGGWGSNPGGRARSC